MTLPTTGTIALSQMRTEFGLSNPVSLSQMRGRAGAPSTGSISFSTMRGRSNVTFTPPAGSLYAEGYWQISQQISCSVAATWTFSLPSGVTATITSGSSSTIVTFTLTSGSQAKPLERNVVFSVTAVAGGVTANYSVTLQGGSDI